MTKPREFLRGHRSGEIVQRERLALHRDVAVGIGGGARG